MGIQTEATWSPDGFRLPVPTDPTVPARPAAMDGLPVVVSLHALGHHRNDDAMNAQEANTAFAVICNWRGQPLNDSERAAWKNRIWQWSATNFDIAINDWEQSDKAHMRPTIGDLAALMPIPVRMPDEWEPVRPDPRERQASPEWVAAWFAEQRQKLGIA